VDALAQRRAVARRLPLEVAGRIGPGALSPARRLAETADAARAVPARLVALDAAALRGAYEAAQAWSAAWLWNDLGRVALALAERLPGPAPVAADYATRSAELFDALERRDAAKAERLLGAHFSRLDRGLLDAFAPPAPGPTASPRPGLGASLPVPVVGPPG
jgi:DNA-binding GntR family transcriptional regulator